MVFHFGLHIFFGVHVLCYLKKIKTAVFVFLYLDNSIKILYVACSPAVMVESFVTTMKRKHVLLCSCVCHVFSYSFRSELC